MVSTSEFLQQLEIGLATEKSIWMIPPMRAYAIIPQSLIQMPNGGGPRVINGRTLGLGWVLPDAQLYSLEKAWAAPLEIRGKGHANFTTITQEDEHGFGLQNTRELYRFQKLTRQKLVIIVDEIKTGEVLAATLDKLLAGKYFDHRTDEWKPRPRKYEGNKMNRGGMAFFGRNQFTVFHQRPPADLPLFANAGIAVPPTLPVETDLTKL